jgi:hypothetical protein
MKTRPGSGPALAPPPAAAVAPKPVAPAKIDFQSEGEVLPAEHKALGVSLEQIP